MGHKPHGQGASLAATPLYEKIKPPMTRDEAIIEASRCLFCYDAPCVQACPTSIDIPMFIRQIASDNVKGSARTIFTQNIMGKSCAYVCPTQMLCEGSCVYNGLNEDPIDIGRLQGYATDWAVENNARFFHPGEKTGKKVAVIGGGPAGLACAHELTRLGHTVVVFEASERAGGLNAYGVAPYKLANEDAAKEVEYVQAIGFEVRTGVRVVPDATKALSPKEVALPQLEKEYDAIFLAVGLGISKRLALPGEQLPGVIGAAEFIYSLRDAEADILKGTFDAPRQVVVIGAGNTAIDAAVESAKLGATVHLVYRRGPEDQNAYEFEIDHAKQAGVNFTYLASPVEILGTGHVEGVRFIRNEKLTAKTEVGSKPKTEIRPIAGSEFILPCEQVVLATGQEKMIEFYGQIPGIEQVHGRVQVSAHYQTGNPKYFAGGDCVNGGREVVHAVAHGRDAARGIHAVLCPQPVVSVAGRVS